MTTQHPVVIFGDVHGDNTKLRALISQAQAKYGTVHLFSVGDLNDRGPDVPGVLDTCIEYGIQGILGNHELWLHKYLSTGEFGSEALHFMMGGKATIQAYSDRAGAQMDLANSRLIQKALKHCIPESHKQYILTLPLYRTVIVAGTTYWLIHAGLKAPLADSFREFAEQSASAKGMGPVSDEVLMEVIATIKADSLLWDHYNDGDQMYQFLNGAVQVFGHAPQPSALDAGHFIALDTGCGRKKKPNALSAVVLLPDGGREFIAVA
ncbi:metallophosphoesterase [Deltaproteobacteria bacterium]|nr:metallophosphoesterase [Deltaproteobacteria bacterium]